MLFIIFYFFYPCFSVLLLFFVFVFTFLLSLALATISRWRETPPTCPSVFTPIAAAAIQAQQAPGAAGQWSIAARMINHGYALIDPLYDRQPKCTTVVKAIRECASRGHWDMDRCPAIQPFPIEPDRDPSEAIARPRKSTGSGDSGRRPMRCQWPGSGSSQRAII